MPAGFLISIGSGTRNDPTAPIESCFREGRYATLLSRQWSAATSATLGDFINMKPGDNIYLFSNRLIYGIGEIIEAGYGKAAVALYPGATDKSSAVPERYSVLLSDGKEKCYRWAVYFKPSPFFFMDGVDMDDLLNSNPSAFTSLRSFWKRSFIQLDAVENYAFKSALIRMNQQCLNSQAKGCHFPYLGDDTPNWCHPDIASGSIAPIDVSKLLADSRKPNGSLSSEMILEVGLLSALNSMNSSASHIFGSWDYVSHQVVASPFKPVEYMDRIDVFGYRWIRGYEEQIISKYLVIEIKKDAASISDSTSKRDYNQLMKYVDWICENYAHGDYSMVEAALIAHSFDFTNTNEMKEEITRTYVTGHQARSHTWSDVKFVSYSVDKDGSLHFELE